MTGRFVTVADWYSGLDVEKNFAETKDWEVMSAFQVRAVTAYLAAQRFDLAERLILSVQERLLASMMLGTEHYAYALYSMSLLSLYQNDVPSARSALDDAITILDSNEISDTELELGVRNLSASLKLMAPAGTNLEVGR